MKKRTLALLLAAVFAVSMIAGMGAAGLISEIKAELRRDFTIRVDGDKQIFRNVDGERVYPILFEGTTYLPVRAIGELMDKTVYWDEGKKEIDLRTEDPKETTTVTDADVIFDSKDNKTEKTDKKEKTEKTEKANKKETVDTSTFIGEEKAKAIALKKAGITEDEADRLKVSLDRDNGIWEYEVEIRVGRTEYDADINAETGEIIKWEVDSDD
ncbi:MAG: PepSY domain-containing protein [Clostridia bacterium]|nr:PepSY domain-containing protein [Clostridia bacterium]